MGELADARSDGGRAIVISSTNQVDVGPAIRHLIDELGRGRGRGQGRGSVVGEGGRGGEVVTQPGTLPTPHLPHAHNTQHSTSTSTLTSTLFVDEMTKSRVRHRPDSFKW